MTEKSKSQPAPLRETLARPQAKTPVVADQRLSEIREILFGEQVRGQEEKARELTQRVDDLKAAWEQRVSTLETYARGAASQATEGLKSQRSEYTAAVNRLEVEAAQLETKLLEHTRMIEQTFATRIETSTKQTENHLDAILKEIRVYRDEVTQSIASLRREFSVKMVERQALAQVLTQLAQQLQQPDSTG